MFLSESLRCFELLLGGPFFFPKEEITLLNLGAKECVESLPLLCPTHFSFVWREREIRRTVLPAGIFIGGSTFLKSHVIWLM